MLKLPWAAYGSITSVSATYNLMADYDNGVRKREHFTGYNYEVQYMNRAKEEEVNTLSRAENYIYIRVSQTMNLEKLKVKLTRLWE